MHILVSSTVTIPCRSILVPQRDGNLPYARPLFFSKILSIYSALINYANLPNPNPCIRCGRIRVDWRSHGGVPTGPPGDQPRGQACTTGVLL